MAGVAVATPTLPLPHQHLALLSLLATPTLTCWLIILCFGYTNFGNHPPPGADPRGGGHGGHDPPLEPRGTTGLPGAPPAYQGHHRPAKGFLGHQRAPQTWQGHHRPLRGHTNCLAGAPQACQGHQSELRALLRACQDLKGHQCTTGLSGAPQTCQGHRSGSQSTAECLLGHKKAPHACQGVPIRGTTIHMPSMGFHKGLSGAPQGCQGHHRVSRGTTDLSGAPQAFQGNLLLCLLSRNHCDRLLF